MSLIDTNVLRVANQAAPQASPACVLTCVELLDRIRQHGGLVLDEGGKILEEYYQNARANGQPGVGDAFLHWCLLHQYNPAACEQVAITPHDERGYEEFPEDERLKKFDRSDRKFVAAALAYGQRGQGVPVIHNATDSDWVEHYAALTAHGVRLAFVCPDYLTAPV